MFKISSKNVSFVVILAILIKNCSSYATPMTDQQNENCQNIALAGKDCKVAVYKKFVESLSDAKTHEKLKHHGNQKNKHHKDLNNASNECLNKFCDSINTSNESLSIQEALNIAYRKEIESCDA